MKERLEQRYNLAYRILNEKIGRDCYFPDGPPRCLVCPIRVLDPLFPILGPLSTAELLPAGEAERYRSEDCAPQKLRPITDTFQFLWPNSRQC